MHTPSKNARKSTTKRSSYSLVVEALMYAHATCEGVALADCTMLSPTQKRAAQTWPDIEWMPIDVADYQLIEKGQGGIIEVRTEELTKDGQRVPCLMDAWTQLPEAHRMVAIRLDPDYRKDLEDGLRSRAIR